MSSPSSGAQVVSTTPLLERNDIHKSCKTVEVIINLLNDYCEATNALVLIQRKLYKALKETGNAKGGGEVAGELQLGMTLKSTCLTAHE